jgi:hypothetical protein
MRADQVIVPAIRELVSRPRLADVLFRFDRWGNPFDPINAVDPFPAWKHQKQTDGPVVHRKLYQQWFIYGYEEARFVLSSDGFITSNQMETLLGIRPYTKLTTQAQEFMKLWLLLVDPPVHTRLRRLVNKAFTPRRVAELEPRVAALVDELLDQLDEQTVEGRPTVEIMSAFCERLPVAVIAEMLGLPRERWEWSRRTTNSMVQLLSPFDKFDVDPINDVIADVHNYWGQLADERRRRTGGGDRHRFPAPGHGHVEDAPLLLGVDGQVMGVQVAPHVVDDHVGPFQTLGGMDRGQGDRWRRPVGVVGGDGGQVVPQPAVEGVGVVVEAGDGQDGGQLVAVGGPAGAPL